MRKPHSDIVSKVGRKNQIRRTLVLRSLLDNGPQSITELTKNTGMTMPVASSIVSTLKNDVSTLKSDVSALKADVAGLKSDMTEVKLIVARIDERLTATLPHLATKVELAEKPSKTYMWGIMAALLTAYGCGLAALAVLR